MIIQLPTLRAWAKTASRAGSTRFLFAAQHACRLFSQQLPDFDPKVDYYKILGLKSGASEAEIKKQYYKLAQ
jgi:hypothetical protein